MSLITLTAPTYYPVSRTEAKLWLREDGSDQDAVIDLLIATMTNYAENLTLRAFAQRQLELNLECFYPEQDGDADIDLPFAPLVSVQYVKYIDTSGVLQTLATDQYDVNTREEPGCVQPAYGCAWPAIRAWAVAPVRIGYTAGYAAVGSPVDEAAYRAGIPPEVKLWMHARIATLYENREQLAASAGSQALVEIPRNFADGMLDSLIIGDRLF